MVFEAKSKKSYALIRYFIYEKLNVKTMKLMLFDM